MNSSGRAPAGVFDMRITAFCLEPGMRTSTYWPAVELERLLVVEQQGAQPVDIVCERLNAPTRVLRFRNRNSEVSISSS